MSLISITEPRPSVSGPKYWRSLNELADTPEFRKWVHQEFPANATEMLEGNSRRTVLKLMAASFGLAGLAACHRPVEHILPNSKGTDADIYTPGEPYFYTTVMSIGGHVTGLLIETHDGRPTKVEGNPDHPHSLGAATALQQATVLDVYDPDRSARVLAGGKPSTWANFEAAVKGLSLGDGTGLRFLSGGVTSPSLAALRADALKKFPKAKWVDYEAAGRENELAGAALAFGAPHYVHPKLDKAKVILDGTTEHQNPVLEIGGPCCQHHKKNSQTGTRLDLRLHEHLNERRAASADPISQVSHGVHIIRLLDPFLPTSKSLP